MNRAEKLNKLFSGDDANSIIKSQISPFNSSTTSKENPVKQLEDNTTELKEQSPAQKRSPAKVTFSPDTKKQATVANSSKENSEKQQNSPESKKQTPATKRFPARPKAVHFKENKKPESTKAAGNTTANKKPSIIKSKVFSRNNTSKNPSKKMSDWGDEETTEVIGKGFGNDNEAYKSNNDDDYQNEDDNNNDNYKKRFNGGGGGGRGRNGGGGGRGGGRGGHGFNRYNKDNDDNEENGESNAHSNLTSHELYQNPIFALTPKDFHQETLQYFLNNMYELFRKANLVQKYTLMKYLMEAYERVLKRSDATSSRKLKHTTQTKSKEKNKNLQQLPTNLVETVTSPTVRSLVTEENLEDMGIEIPTDPKILSPQSDSIDLLQIFQQDFNQHWNDKQNLLAMQDNLQEFQDNLTMLSPPPQLPTMNISDLFENDNFNSSDDLQLSFLRQPQQQQQPLNVSSTERRRKTEEIITPRRSERIQAQGLQHISYDEREVAQSRASNQTLRCNMRSQAAAINIQYLSDTPPATPKRSKPRTFITEEEYSLRFRLPRRKFLEIHELPHARYNIETSSYSYFPMDMTLINEEYLYVEDANHLPTTGNNLLSVQLQPTNSLLVPTAGASLTPSALGVTGDNLSSLNVVRQAPSSMMELSSFARPLMPVAGMDISRIEEERSRGIAQDMSPIIEPVGVQDNDINISIESASSTGAVAATGEILQPRFEPPNIMDEPITLPSVERPRQINTDSGIHLPTPNLQTTDSAIVMPTSMNIDSSSAPQTAPRGQTKHPEPISSDTGIFKTPMIPGHMLKQPTTFPSEEESLFQINLKNRTLDVSTPLTGLETLKTRKTLLVQIETEAASATDVSTMGNITVEGVQTEQIIQQSEIETAAAPLVQEKQILQAIEEVRESNIRPSTQLFNVANSVSNAPNQFIQNVPVQQINQPTADDDYRKDWYEILRARLQNTNYENTTTPKRKPKHRRPHRRQPLHERKPQQEPQQELQNILSQENSINDSSSKLLQQTLAGILPPLPPPNSSPNQNLNATVSSSNSIGAAGLPASDISPQQQQYDQFILDNAENISTVMDNLNSCRTMLDNHLRGLEAKLNSGTFNKPRQHFDPTVLINAPKQRLAVKLSLLQNIIRQVSFDFTKCDCIKDRMSAAIAFAFLLELKSAGIISLSGDGRTVALR